DQALSATKGSWEGSPSFTFKWLRCPPNVADKSEKACSQIAGATKDHYTASAEDLGKRLVVKVTAANKAGSDVALSAPSAPVAEKGPGRAGRGEGNPPQTKLPKPPPKKAALRPARFAFSADQPGSTFQCKLDRGPFKSCRSPFKHKVKPGRHSFQ